MSIEKENRARMVVAYLLLLTSLVASVYFYGIVRFRG